MTIFFGIINIVSTGFSLININLFTKDFIISFLYPFLFFLCSIITHFINDISFLIYLLQIILLIFWIKKVFNNLDIAKSLIKAHLYLIAQNGINPITTPIFEKYKIYSNLLLFLFLSSFSFLIFYFILFLLNSSIWIIETIENIYQIILFIILSYLYRPRTNEIESYLNADADDDLERVLIDLNEIDDSKLFIDLNKSNWNIDMKLPKQPNIKN